MLRVPKGFVDQVLWPEFQELNRALTQYLNEVTTRIIREEVHRDTSEATEVMQPLLPTSPQAYGWNAGPVLHPGGYQGIELVFSGFQRDHLIL